MGRRAKKAPVRIASIIRLVRVDCCGRDGGKKGGFSSNEWHSDHGLLEVTAPVAQLAATHFLTPPFSFRLSSLLHSYFLLRMDFRWTLFFDDMATTLVFPCNLNSNATNSRLCTVPPMEHRIQFNSIQFNPIE